MIAHAMPDEDLRARPAPAAVAVPRLCRLSVIVTPAEPVRLPALPGSELRGLLRQGLERLGRLADDAPSPFTLTPQWLDPGQPPDRLVDWPAGHDIRMRVLWFGGDPDPAALVGAGFGAVGWQPLLGRGRRARFVARIERSHAGAGHLVERRMAELGGPLTLRALTPMALRERGAMRETLGDGRALLISIRHRAHRLAERFGAADVPPLESDRGSLEVLADETARVRWHRLGRQGRRVPAQGWMGSARLAPPTAEVLRALVVGELICAGRWTAFGAGRYALAAAEG